MRRGWVFGMCWSGLKQALPREELGAGPYCVIPIWPEFAQQIYDGRKIYEFRKIAPRPTVSTFLVYETSPVSMITGCFLAAAVVNASPEDIWSFAANSGGISSVKFFQYFAGRDNGFAIPILQAARFLKPICLSTFGHKPPQSYIYI